MSELEDRTFVGLVIGVSLAFVWILWPFSGAVLWAIIGAILFTPLYRHLLRAMRRRRTLAAFTTVIVVIVMVILPLGVIVAMLVQEASGVYERIQSGDIDIGRYFRVVFAALPEWVIGLLARSGLTSLGDVQERLSTVLLRSSQFLAGRALNIGQNAVDFVVSLFVMLYLLFFLLRDGDDLTRRLKQAVPLRAEHRQALLDRFAAVIYASVKGNIVVAVVQGALGGLSFWFLGIHAAVLWGALMAVLSLLPAVGTALVWVPVAIYLLATGAVWQGIVLIAWGVLVIGLVDNVMRPFLVGKDIRMPDYLVLISTLGGLAVFGVNGFVIGPIIAALFMTVWDIFATSRSGAR